VVSLRHGGSRVVAEHSGGGPGGRRDHERDEYAGGGEPHRSNSGRLREKGLGLFQDRTAFGDRAVRADVTRFDAHEEHERRELVADAVRAHRERDSAYLTVVADGDEPWVQFGDGVVNLDCTDAELERLESLLGEFPDFEVSERTTPETAEGTNVRVATHAGPDRVGQFLERVFRTVYGQPDDGRLWVTEV
jgi:hypothetical protein